ncbi:MAG: response regulator [Thermomicrobiales bacterium]
MTDSPPAPLPRVLVVDDEDNITFLVSRALQLAGMDTVSVATGQEALDLVGEWRPDAIVLDVMLPDVDGFTVLQRIRDRGQRTPVVFLTARDTTADRVQWVERWRRRLPREAVRGGGAGGEGEASPAPPRRCGREPAAALR